MYTPSFQCQNMELEMVFHNHFSHKNSSLPMFQDPTNIFHFNPQILFIKIPQPALSEIHTKQPTLSWLGKLGVKENVICEEQKWSKTLVKWNQKWWESLTECGVQPTFFLCCWEPPLPPKGKFSNCEWFIVPFFLFVYVGIFQTWVANRQTGGALCFAVKFVVAKPSRAEHPPWFGQFCHTINLLFGPPH